MPGIHIVHLEDDTPLRDVLKLALETLDPSVNLRQFISSDEAIAYIESNAGAIDLFVLDIRVPGKVDGMGVAQRIREMKCPGAIVVTSAYRQPNREMLMSLTCDWFPKPWHLMEITRKMLEIAKQRKPQLSSAASFTPKQQHAQ